MNNTNTPLGKAVLTTVILLAVFLLAETIHTIKQVSVLGQGDYSETSITFTGEGEVSATPDVATFNFIVTKEAKTVEDAQAQVEKVIGGTTRILKDNGVDGKDIKTESYNVNPRYEWVQRSELGNSERVFRGYEVSQYTSVKVRNIETGGEILGKIGNQGLTNISGLNFEVDNINDLKREARKLAIEEAKEKAEELAKDLGVRLVRIVSFHENTGGFYPEPYMAKVESLAIGGDMAVEPTLSVGEEEIKVSVSLTYEIR